MDSLDGPPGEGFGPPPWVEGSQNLVPQAPGLMHRNDRVEGVELPAAAVPGQHDQQVRLLGVEIGLVVLEGVVPGVLPAVPALLLSTLHPVDGGEPVSGVGVADAVVEGGGLAVEDGPCDEAPVLLSLDETLVLVDQGDLRSGRGLGQGRVAGRDGHERRQQQRRRQGYQPLGSTGNDSRFQRQLVHLPAVCCEFIDSRLSQ